MSKLSEPMKNALRYVLRVERNDERRWSMEIPKTVTRAALVSRGLIYGAVSANGHKLTEAGYHLITLEGLAEGIDEAMFANGRLAEVQRERIAEEAKEDAAYVRELREAASGRTSFKVEDAETADAVLGEKGNSFADFSQLAIDALPYGYTEIDRVPVGLSEEEIQRMAGGDPLAEALMRKLAPLFGFVAPDQPTTGIGGVLAPFAEEIANRRFEEGLSALLAGVGAESAPKEEEAHETAGSRSERAQEACSIVRDAVEYIIPGHGQLVNHGHDYGTRISVCTNLEAADVPHVLAVQAGLVKAAMSLGEEWIGLATTNVAGWIHATVYTAADPIAKGGSF